MGTQNATIEAAKAFDIATAFRKVGGDDATGEVAASRLIGYIQRELHYTFERARDLLNLLIEMGRAKWTTFSVVRLTGA